MPSVQIVNTQPAPRTEQTILEKTAGGFAQQFRQNQLQKQETDALGAIYRQYQNDGQNIDSAIFNVQSNPDISPTMRVKAAGNLLQMKKTNAVLQKQAVAQQNREKGKQALKDAGADEQQIALYDAAPVGGQTKIIEDVIDTRKRSKTPAGLSSPDITDYDAGLTPQERVRRQDERFKVQTPLVIKNSESLNALESESRSLELLNELNNSGRVGQGINRLNINPKTGDLFIPQFANPEEQLFVKTVNDFTVKAKDSFGGRVTNYELNRFMQRLPTLANSPEGRKLIMRQMRIVNEINQLEKRAIQQVFDKYGPRNIDYVDAENKAREEIEEPKEALRKEYFNLEQLARKEEAAFNENIKKKTKPGYTALRTPEGKILQFPNKSVPNLEEKGYKKL